MIHTKSLVQRLAYGPLLVIGLVLGWSGEAEAEAKYTINVKLEQNEDGSIAYHVVLRLNDGPTDEDTSVDLGSSLARFVPETYRIEAPTFLIPAGETETTGTILLFPIVELDGIAATPRSIREDADEPVVVTLTISLKESSKKDEVVSLAIVSPTQGKTAKRDEDFTATLPDTITIPAGEITGTAQMTVQPKDNTTADGNKAFAVQATSPDGYQALINIRIIDNDVELDGIAAAPQSIREDADEPVTVTLTISLRRSSRKDESVSLAIVSPTQGKTAKRDEDFTATLPDTITIPAGTIKATAQMTVQPQDNTTADGDKAFAVQATSPSGHRALANIQIIDDEAANTTASAGDDSATPDEGDDSATPDEGEDSATPDEGEDDGQAEDGGAATFAFASAVEDQAYTEGTAITALMLPEATDGQGAITYRVLGLPAGLTFDAATRIVSGTPTAATDGAVEVAYLAQDSAGRGITLTFSITVNSALSFGDLFK